MDPNYTYNFKDSKKLKNYQELPQPDYFPNFKENPDDYLLMFDKPKEFDQDILNVFKETLRDLLPKEIDIAELSVPVRDTKCWYKKKSVNVYKVPEKEFYFTKAMRGKRCVIPVGPANYRDSLLLDPKSLYTVYNIEKQVACIVNRLPGCYYNKDFAISTMRLKKALKSPKKDPVFYWHRDFSKCGLKCPPG
jgi:hypothetical protein